MLCNHPLGNFSFNSTCDFHCIPGFTLQGSQSLQCTAAGQWTAETPSCEAVKCGKLEIPEKGYMNCSHPLSDFSYKSVCTLNCDKGFHLGGSDSIQCGTSGQWNGRKPTCEVHIFNKMWEPQKATVATVGTAFTLLLLSFVVWGIIRRYRKAKQEKNPLSRNEDNLERTTV
ncbi:E-selectin-like [Mobula hypostoma]|uniref:E-selectin-like n=1 Tax=Mobula hypostoma TaxID=723540 RepID=UPI002FC2F967